MGLVDFCSQCRNLHGVTQARDQCTWVKLDKDLVNLASKRLFPLAFVSILHSSHSDHNLLLLSLFKVISRLRGQIRRPFLFEPF